MIRPNKGGPLGWAWIRYVDWRLDRTFRGVWLSGALPVGDRPVLFYANHPGWWDGFAFHRLTRAHGLDGYCLMEEKNLARFPFLARLGAFSIRKRDPRSALETLRFAAKLLSRPRSALVVFPTGELDPTARPPFRLERGVEVLARASGALCLPLGLRYGFFVDERPELLVHAGQPHPPAPLERFAEGLQEAHASVHAHASVEGLTRLRRSAPSPAPSGHSLPGGEGILHDPGSR